VFRNLQQKKVQYHSEVKNQLLSIVLFPDIRYNINNNGMLELLVTRSSLDFLLNLGQEYTKYNIDIFLQFQSVYSQRMYEIVMMELRNSNRKTFVIEVAELQKYSIQIMPMLILKTCTGKSESRYL
jgi:plasmid replication initiation protein